ncbi:MAG: CoA transferase [Salibacteraceae bacterium]|nr:CoA transferase [Salibacteraceae bacterium]|tara:strand:- start:65682 stop:66728 length:1047 start_codon:yes stop_codon:yes gene_type:complete
MKIKDLKILELASVLAGPSVGSFFAELGAQVIKVENPLLGGDLTRKWKQPDENPENNISAYYAAANINKQIKYLNFLDSTDRQLLNLEIKECDILIVNFKPGDAVKFNLTFKNCKQQNSDIIYAEITGYGPDSNRSAFDLVLQAETGYLSINGSKETPAKLPVAFIDLFAAHQLKAGVLMALLEQRAPCKVSVSLYDAAVSSLANQATNQLMNDNTPSRLGTLHPNIAPYGEVALCSDGVSFVLAVGNNAQFENLLKILHLKTKNEFETNTLRLKNRKALFDFLKPEIAKISSLDFSLKCNATGVPIGKILNLKEVFETEKAQNLIMEEIQEGEETKKVKTAVFVITS